MTNYSFTKIDVPAAAGTYQYISVDGVDAAGEAVGNYGNVDGDGDQTFHGLVATTANGTRNDPGGSSNTDIVGITPGGEIFGDYVDSANRQHGFVENNGGVTNVDVFLANSTTVDGVTSAGVIYGTYADFANAIHGFTDNNGSFTQIDLPGANTTSIAGINASGTIAGTYTDSQFVAHGFVDSNGTFTSFDPQGSILTSVVGISDAGVVVGNYQDSSNNTHGFVDNNGVITTISIPGAASTGVSAINAAGEIVGYYADSGGNIHGFVDQSGVITTVDIPGATETDILGIGATGEISGYYDDSHGNQHGFVGAPAAAVLNDGPLSIEAGATQTITTSLLDATDNVSSGAALHYTVTTNPVDGTLLLNGVATTSFTQADINNGLVSYHETAGGSATSDNFHFTVTDAAGNTTATESFQIAINQPPVLTIPSANVSASPGQVFAASSLFSASDANSDVLSYYLYDATPAANSGHFVVNGMVVPADTVYAVTAAQLAETTFVAGAAGVSDDLFAMATDGQSNSNNNAFSEFHVNAAGGVNHAPVLTVPSANVSASAGQSLAASSLFSASDADGNTLSYYLYDATPAANSGHFVVNGMVVPADTVYTVTAAQLAQTTFVAGAAGVSDDLFAMATDGQANSNNNAFSEFHVNVGGDQAPVLTIPSANVSASPGQAIAASSLFSATDANGDTLSYYLYDGTAAANSGHFVVNGTVVPADTVYTVTAAQLAQTTFVAGAAGVSDDLFVMATDGQSNSNNNVFSEFHVNAVGAGQAPAAANASTVAPQPVSVATLDAQAHSDPAGHIASTVIHDFHLLI